MCTPPSMKENKKPEKGGSVLGTVGEYMQTTI